MTEDRLVELGDSRHAYRFIHRRTDLMKARPKNDYWYRFKVGARVEGIPTSASLAGQRGTVVGYSERSDAMCVVDFDDGPQEAVTVSLLQPLGAIESLGELADGRG